MIGNNFLCVTSVLECHLTEGKAEGYAEGEGEAEGEAEEEGYAEGEAEGEGYGQYCYLWDMYACTSTYELMYLYSS